MYVYVHMLHVYPYIHRYRFSVCIFNIMKNQNGEKLRIENTLGIN